MKFLREYGPLILLVIICFVIAVSVASILPNPESNKNRIEQLEQRVEQLENER